MFSSYTPQFQHSHPFNKLHGQRSYWKKFFKLKKTALNWGLIFSLTILPSQDLSNNSSSPVVRWPGSTAPRLCLRAGLLVLKRIKEDTLLAPASLTRIRTVVINKLWRSGMRWSFWKTKCCAIRRKILMIYYSFAWRLPCLIQHQFMTVKAASKQFITLHAFFGLLF